MADHDYFFSTQGGLEAAEGATAIFDALYYAVEVLEVLPDEAANAWVVRDAFFGAIGQHISLCRTADQDIVNVGNSCIGNFGLKNISDIVMEYRNGVRSPHQESDESERAKRGLEGG